MISGMRQDVLLVCQPMANAMRVMQIIIVSLMIADLVLRVESHQRAVAILHRASLPVPLVPLVHFSAVHSVF